MNTTGPLVQLLSNGSGRWFAQCYWCRRCSPSWPAADELHVLAAAQAAGWQARERGDLLGAGKHVLVCRPCRRVR